ncbi:MAG TPA: YggS family pyridoxal phosphate-dependent enzyme [Acidimicrobiia bacterium]
MRSRILAAGGDESVEVLAVTKGFGPDAVRAAAQAGCRAIGENYAQELATKAAAAAAAGVAVHFIGRVQSNKVRQLAGTVAVWETIDRPSLVSELARRAPGATVLVQVNATAEPAKGGCAPADVAALVDRAVAAGLVVDGLMTIGPTTGGAEVARPGFRLVRRLVDELGLATCSMGMTGDLEVAVQEGSTRVRLGTALFGPRR